MANEKKQGDEEYQFVDTESISAIEEGTSHRTISKEAPFGKGIRKKLVIALGVVFVVLAVYQLLDTFFAPQETKKLQAPLTMTSLPFAKKPVKTASFGERGLQKELDQQEGLKSFEKRLTRSEITSGSIRDDSKMLSNRINNVQSNLEATLLKLEQISKAIEQLTAQDELMRQQLAKLTSPPKPAPKTSAVQVSKVTYFLQAAIPGRAWLQAPNGATITISEGGTLSGYGVVTRIDPKGGVVDTSSGRVISYSPSDK